jgi:hypothetical protein
MVCDKVQIKDSSDKPATLITSITSNYPLM